MIFNDRLDAGKKLAEELKEYEGKQDVIVVGLARGGVVVAAEIARKLKIPLDVVVVRKIGAPDNEELALGAVAEEGEGVFNDDLISLLGVSKEYLKKEIERQREIALQRKASYFEKRHSVELANKTVILVDDGIATGASMRVAIESIRARGVAKIVLAVPVAASESLEQITKKVDEVVCLSKPSLFQAVGAFYRDFAQVSDEEIIALLRSRENTDQFP